MPVPLPPSPWAFEPDEWPADDCIAGGADLEPATLVDAYRNGAFPMPHGRRLLWWSPMERGVLGPGDLKVSRSLRRSLRDFTITVDTDFDAVIDAWEEGGRIVMAGYRDRPGHPVLFDSIYWDELAKLTGEQGGRDVIKQHPDEVVYVPVETESPMDVYREADWRVLQEWWAKHP